MSPLAKMIIQALENEDDDIVLAEVLDFYEYLKEKKERHKIFYGKIYKKMNRLMKK